MRLHSQTTDTPETLRRHFVREAQKQGDMGGTFRVDGDDARRAFPEWDYVRILEWAAENRLTVDFLPHGALDLGDFCCHSAFCPHEPHG